MRFLLKNGQCRCGNPGFKLSQYLPILTGDGSVGTGVFLGLLLGKPIGITPASWLAIA